MDNHQIICHECKCAITNTKGTLYNTDLQAYTCKSCVKKMVYQIQNHDLSRGERSKVNSFLVFAVAFLVLSVPYFFSGNTFRFVLSLVMFPASIVLFVLYCKAWFRVRHKKILLRQTELYNKRQAKEKAQAEAEQPWNKPWDCPSCGAHTIGQRCEYCDSYYRE